MGRRFSTGLFPESFQVWKTARGDSHNVVGQNSPPHSFCSCFHNLSRVFSRFCRWFSAGTGRKSPQKACLQARKVKFSGFPQSQHPLLRLLRPFYLLFCLSLFLCQRGEMPPEYAKRLKICAHANSSDKIPLLKVLGVLRTFFQEGSKWVWAKPKVFPFYTIY